MTHQYIFHNFTDKPFDGYWNGKKYTFKPGVKKQYDRGIAVHFAKHLTNQVLLEKGKEESMSPKRPEDVPEFMAIFEKALIIQEIPESEDLDIDTGGRPINEPSMNINTKPREQIDQWDATKAKAIGPGSAPQIVGDDSNDEADYEDSNSKEDVKEGGSEAK